MKWLLALLKNLSRSKAFGYRAARVLILVPAGLIVLVMTFEDKLIYLPSTYPEGFWQVSDIPSRPGDIVPQIEDCYFTTADGLRLHGWYCTPHRNSQGVVERVKAEKVLLWFHGNAGNISYRYEMIRVLMKLPVEIFIIDYRGYGKSEGSPSEHGLYLDAQAAWDYLTGERGVPAERIVIFGKSLGGVPAIDLATKVQPAGLIVQSSFTSARDVAARILPFYPGVLLRTKMDSASKIAKVACPKLFVHSRADEVIPFELGWRLYEAATQPKQFYEVKDSPHNSTFVVGGEEYLNVLRRFAESCTAPD